MKSKDELYSETDLKIMKSAEDSFLIGKNRVSIDSIFYYN
jgi:hypothetical protein